MTMTSSVAVRIALFASCLIVAVRTMKDHVPQAACASMMPLGHDADAQQSTPPYLLMVPKGPIPVNSEINVVVTGNFPEDMFRGFFVKGFHDETGNVVGNFTVAPKTINCEQSADGAHHANNTLKESVMLNWLPPLDFKGSVTFMATIVKDRPTYWTGIVSNSITFE